MALLKRPIHILLIFLVAAAAAGCGRQKSYKIGVSQCSSDDWRSKMNEEIEREAMLHDDISVEIRSADDDNARQIADIRHFAESDCDIIIVAPNEAEALTPVIREIYRSGIPVIVFDRDIADTTYTARIGVDNEGLGRSAAHYALHLVPDSPRAIEIRGRRGSTPADGRHAGFEKEFTAGGGEIIAGAYANWRKEDAARAADSLLRQHPEADIVYAHNDRMAIGASEVAERLGRRGDIRIIGIDAAPGIGLKAVADSVIDATFLYPTEGHRLIQTAIAILKGEPYEKETVLPLSSAVDLSNADILTVQNEALAEETDKMKVLKKKIDDYWARHSAQTSLFYASIAIIVLLFGVFFLMLRNFWQHKRHQAVLLEQNRLLEQERDKQKELNERLNEATQSKLSFFTNVSHDLRTPLTLIAEPVAQLAAADNLTERQHTLMKIADKNVHILRRLINQILDFRKFENGRLTVHLREGDIAASLREWLDAFSAMARKRDITLTLRIDGKEGDADSRLPMAFDAEKMERVVFNLVSNAFKHTPDNGSITVEAAIDGDTFRLTVADTGEGIEDRDLGNIFDRFYQADRVHPNGSGIGLALCKAFVELHEGKIEVRSKVGEGTAFTVGLPVRHVAETPEEKAAPAIDAESVQTELENIEQEREFSDDKPLLLVIDDNPDIRAMLETLLGDDYNVLTARDGKEGLRKAVRYVPDIIICDVMMPVMDGMECCRRIKEEVTTSHIPVLMLTACSLDKQRVQGYESGADGYLAKPFNAEVMKSRCASLIANRKRIRSLWETPGLPAGFRQEAKATTKNATAKTTKASSPAASTPTTSDIDDEFYLRFLEIFKADMGNPEMNVDAIASRMGLERSQFYRKIKALTNYAPVELMRRLRLREARRMLKATDTPVSQIAYACGFSTPAYFAKCYRDAYGETPSETRAALH